MTQIDDNDDENIEELTPKKSYCPDCNKGILTHLDLGIRILYNCNMCDYRAIRKWSNNEDID